MIFDVLKIVYPEGDTQEVRAPLKINQIVDLNGNVLRLPLPSSKMIVYKVYKISRKQTRNEYITYYYLDQIPSYELESYVR